MPRLRPLPAHLGPVFTVAEARASGVTSARLASPDLRRPVNGVRSLRALPIATSLEERCREIVPRLKEWQFFSHETALALHGAPMPDWPYMPRIHVSAHRPSREPRTAGIVGHRLQARESATAFDRRGFPVEHPVRAWRQVGSLWGIDDLVACAEHLITELSMHVSVNDLRNEVGLMGDTAGGILTRALAMVRPGARSARETRLRLLLVRAGLPSPEITWTLRDARGRHVAELDLAYPRWCIGVEYDGRVHAQDVVQFAKDADRWDRIRAEGWDHVRILNHHLSNRGVPAIQKVRDALIRAGWTPGAR